MTTPPFPHSSPPALNGIVRSDALARAAYAEGAGIFRIVPDAVVIPSTTRALGELVRWARSAGAALIPRGAGSGMPGGNVGRGTLVDLTVLDGAPLIVDPVLRRAWAGAAVTFRALGESAFRLGLRLPPNPSSARFASLGGMLSTNASGPRSVRAGSVRRWVEALDWMTPDGELVSLRRGVEPPRAAAVERFDRDAAAALTASRTAILAGFPRTRKNSSGYALDAWLRSGDLIDLLVGAEGTLGFITAAEWRLEPMPAAYAGVRAALRQTDGLGHLVASLGGLDPAAVEYLDQTFLRFAAREDGGAAGLLMVEFEGSDQQEVGLRAAAAREILTPHAGEIREAATRAALEELWSIRHAASPLLARLGEGRRSLQVIEDGCVPVEAIGPYIERVRRAGERHGVELVIFGHAGDGNLHVNILPRVDEPDWELRVSAVFNEVSEAVLSLGGTPTGEHGDGRLRAPLLPRVFGPEIMQLFRLVKDAIDPAGIMNPGVKLAEPDAVPLAHLKLGAAAEPLPPSIAARLRTIERDAGYALSRLDLAEH